MIVPYILTMVFTVGMSQGGVATLKVEYNSQATCNAAMEANRESLRGQASIVLATCTKK